MASIKGYELSASPLREGICKSYKAVKDGMNYFVKIYTYTQDDDVSAEKHFKVQTKINSILEATGNITEDLIEHGIIEDFEDRSDLKSTIYYQVKPWYADPKTGECYDFQDYINNSYSEIGKLADHEYEKVITIFDDLLSVCFNIVGLLKFCHRNNLIHQDLKPEQIVMLPNPTGKTKFRPVIADFDWSFIEGTLPLKNIGTLEYHSPEHLLKEPRTKASDIFTLGVIIFKAMGLNIHPLKTDFEMDDFLDASQIEDIIIRAKVQQKLLSIYNEKFPSVPFSKKSVEALDVILAKCLSKNKDERPTAEELWQVLKDNSTLLKKESDPEPEPEPVPEPGPLPDTDYMKKWFTLKSKFIDECKYTITVGAGVMPAQLCIDRKIAKRIFHDMADMDGSPFYKFFGIDEPMLQFSYDEGNWFAGVPNGAPNTFVLTSNSKDITLDSKPILIKYGDTITLFSKKLSRMQDGCQLIVSNT